MTKTRTRNPRGPELRRLVAKTADPTLEKLIAATQLEEGSKVCAELLAVWQAANGEYFGGKLEQPALLLTNTGSPRALGDYTPKDANGLHSAIRMADHAIRRGVVFRKWVVIHEMAHQAQWELHHFNPLNDGYKGHGRVFCEIANEISRMEGWELMVSPKARAPGTVRPESWPQAQLVKAGLVSPPKPKAPKRIKPQETEGGLVVDPDDWHGLTARHDIMQLYIRALAEWLRRYIERTAQSAEHFKSRPRGAQERLRLETLEHVEREAQGLYDDAKAQVLAAPLARPSAPKAKKEPPPPPFRIVRKRKGSAPSIDYETSRSDSVTRAFDAADQGWTVTIEQYDPAYGYRVVDTVKPFPRQS